MAADNIGGRFNPPTKYLEGLRLSQDARPGELTIQWRVSSFTTDELVANQDSGFFANPFGTSAPGAIRGRAPDEYNVEFEFNPSRLGNIQSLVKDRLNEASQEAGFKAQILLNQARGLTGSIDIPSVTETDQVPLGGETEGERTISFTPMRIPVPEGESILEDIPIEAWPVLSFTVSGSVPTQRGPLPVFQSGQRSYQQRIPPAAFIEEVEVSGDCESLYSNIISNIDQLKSNISGAISGASNVRDDMRELAEELATEGGASTPSSDTELANNIEDLNSQDIIELGRDRLQRMRTEAEGVDPRQEEVSEFNNRLDTIRSNISNQVGSRCQSEIRPMLDGIQEEIEELDVVSDQAAALENAILSALSNIESIDCSTAFSGIDRKLGNIESEIGVGSNTTTLTLPLTNDQFENLNNTLGQIDQQIEDDVPSGNPCRDQLLSRVDNARGELRSLQRQEVEPLGCGDISNDLRSTAESLQGSARQWTSKDRLTRKPSTKEDLLDDIDDTISDIKSDVSDNNPCKGRLISRLRDVKALLQRTAARPASAVPCDQRFPEVGSQLDNFEDMVLDLSAPVSPEGVQDIANQGQELISQIEQDIPADSDCRQEMPSRVRSLISRVERLTSQVRVQTEIDDSDAQRREELINQLLGSIDTLEQTTEDANVENIEGDIPQT